MYAIAAEQIILHPAIFHIHRNVFIQAFMTYKVEYSGAKWRIYTVDRINYTQVIHRNYIHVMEHYPQAIVISVDNLYINYMSNRTTCGYMTT